METTVKERLIRYIKYRNLSQKRFERIVGLSNGYVNNISKGIGAEKLQRILSVFPDLNQTWLVTGEGLMIKESTDVTPMAQSDTTDFATSKSGISFRQREDGSIIMDVPVVNISALGSPEDEYATLVQNDEVERIPFVVDGMHHGTYFAFRVDGDSMDDGSRYGFARRDIVLVRELGRDKWLPKLHYKDWPFWVVVWGNNVRIKQIVGQDDAGTITLHSLNPSPEYTDFTLHLDQVSRLFNVVQHIPHPNIFK